MDAGVRCCERGTREAARAKARYYQADLVHTWGSYLFLLGAPWVKIFRIYFRAVGWLYKRIVAESEEGAELMSYDYYWMRHLEARMIANWGLAKDEVAAVTGRLMEIGHRNRLVQDCVQEGNTFAYRALLAYLGHPRDEELADQLLGQAESVWSTSGGTMASGRRRVALFRRFTGRLSWGEAVRNIAGDG